MEKGKNKVIVVLVDGMRPDGMMQTNHPFLETIKARFSYSLTAQTVMPSVTLHTCVDMRSTVGGPSPDAVQAALDDANAWMSKYARD